MAPAHDDDLGLELGRLRRLAHCLVHDAALADDAVQDTLLASLTRRPPLLRSVRAWLDAVLRHRVRRLARRQAAQPGVEGAAARAEAGPGSDEVAATAELHRQLAAEVAALPEPYRTSIVLRFLHELPAGEVAARTGVPIETARTRIRRGLALLRERLDRSYGGRAAWAGLTALPAKPPLLVTAAAIMSLKPLAVVAAAAFALAGGYLVLLPRSRPAEPAVAPTGSVPLAALAPAAPPLLPSERTVVDAPVTSTETGPQVLEGRVIAATTARPVPGAVVDLLHADADEFGPLDPDYRKVVEKVGSATTGDDGAFRFRVPRARLHRLAVQAAGFAPRTVAGCTAGVGATIEMNRGAVLRGVVQGPGGPLPDAVVRVHGRSAIDGVLATTGTAADGVFECMGLPVVAALVEVRAPGHVTAWQAMELADGAAREVEVRLERGRTARGRVVDAATREPVEDAEVGAGWTFEGSTRTARDGTFVLAGLAPTGAELHVRAAGYAAAWTRLTSDVEEPTVEVALRRGALVRGRLIDPQDRPVAGAYVAAAATFHYTTGVHTDWCRGRLLPGGRFEVAGVHGASQLLVRARGHGARLYDLPRQLRDGSVLDLGDIALGAPAGLEGVVRDDAGHPVALATITILGGNDDCASAFAHLDTPLPAGPYASPREVFHFRPAARRSAADGSFRFGGLAGGTYRFLVEVPGSRRVEAGPFRVADGEFLAGLEVVVRRGTTIAGRVEIPAGIAAADVRKLVLTACEITSHHHESARPDADGSFRITGLAGDRFVVSALECPAGYAMSPLYDVAAGAADLAPRLVPALTITGQVVDAAGKGVRAVVHARLDRPAAFMTTNHPTDAEGRFTLFVAPDFVGTVRAAHADEGFLRGSVEGVIAGARDLVVRLGNPSFHR